jgi:hypothetical protein
MEDLTGMLAIFCIRRAAVADRALKRASGGRRKA